MTAIGNSARSVNRVVLAGAGKSPLTLPTFSGFWGEERRMMSPAQDPFHVVREEIQDSIDKLQSTFHQWQRVQSNTGESFQLSKGLITSCESVEWQVDELNKTIAVAAGDPEKFGLDEVELEKRRRWTANARNQVASVKKAITAVATENSSTGSGLYGIRKELMRLPNDRSHQATSHYTNEDNDEFISSESDRQLLLIRQQDEELDELAASVQRIGGVGLTIHEELIGQDKILEDLNSDMDGAANRLDFVQKKVAIVMKKAGAKGQIMMILFLVALFIVLFVLVFLT